MKGNAVNFGLKICSVLGYGEAVQQFGNLEDSVFFLFCLMFLLSRVWKKMLNFKATETRWSPAVLEN